MRTLVVNALRMLGNRTGVGRQLQYLIEHWSRTSVPFDKIVLMAPAEVDLPGLGHTTPIDVRSFGRRWPNLLWEQVALPHAAKGASVLLSAYTCPLRHKGPTVVVNYGIIDAVASTFSLLQRLRATPVNKLSAWKARRVIANSHVVRGDLVRYYGVDPDKIDVVYPGPANVFLRPVIAGDVRAAVAAVFGAPVPYVLFVGKLSQRRYIPNLIEAVGHLRRRGLGHRLLIVGPNREQIPLDDLARQHGLAGDVQYRCFLPQEELALLYRGADLFVLPSTYEGLSQTILEAMASGTPVLAVDHPALAEGAKGACLAVPSPGVNDLVAGMSALLTDRPLHDRYRAKGMATARGFSLADTARRTMDILDTVASASDTRAVEPRRAPRPQPAAA